MWAGTLEPDDQVALKATTNSDAIAAMLRPASPPTVSAAMTKEAAMKQVERYETVIIGGGQAGLSVGYHLKKKGHSFVVAVTGSGAAFKRFTCCTRRKTAKATITKLITVLMNSP